MCDRSYAFLTSDSSRPQCFCMGENFTTIKSFHIYWAQKNTNAQSTTIFHLKFPLHAPVDTRARTRPGGCNMSDDSISECTSQLWSSPGRVLLMVLAATISARLLLAAGHPQYCLLCRGQHFGHRYCDEYTFYCWIFDKWVFKQTKLYLNDFIDCIFVSICQGWQKPMIA